jgi:hypothetical protein
VGADRKGPLAAFVVVALIAAILLITSVRSQAAPWFPTRIVAGPASEPHLWTSVTGGLDRVVGDGVVLVRKSAQAPDHESTQSATVGPSTRVVTARPAVTTTRQVAQTGGHHPSRHHRPGHRPHRPGHVEQPGTAPTAPSGPPTSDAGSPPGRPGHGRHLGWYRHHGQAEPAGDDRPDSAWPGHGWGHGWGHGRGHGWGHTSDHGHGRGHGWGHGWGHGRH